MNRSSGDRATSSTSSASSTLLPRSSTTSTALPDLRPTIHHYLWHPDRDVSATSDSSSLTVTFETMGDGPSILLLPAFSTVSNRAELTALAQALAPYYQVTTLDWPGFGESERPRMAYTPDMYRRFLLDFVQAHWSEPLAVMSAGHAAGVVMALEPEGLWSKVTLVAPTWRGPLAVMGAPQAMRTGIRELVRSPLIGQFLYYLNTRPSFLKWMYRRHVVVDAAQLTPEYMQSRYQSTQKLGARYAPAAFVTGGLDPVHHREEFL
ncbi:MAG: alpha/beta hydrolase, partial [Merismopedia sp. SIO2A8]|nr:alpha/beta hydrolase [Merismopedia sp. SIO2A8]